MTGTAFAVPTAPTFKRENPPLTTPPNNGFDESGLGENAIAPASPPAACSVGPACRLADLEETGGRATVLIQGSSPITDVIIGSVQDTENLNVSVGNDPGFLSLFSSETGGRASYTPGNGATCEVSGFSALYVGVQSGGSGDVLVTALSQDDAVLGPASLTLLGTALAGLEVVRRRRRS
jgi:hypothetical protein